MTLLNFFSLTSEMLNMIAEIDEFKGSWKFINLAPQYLRALHKTATVQSIVSYNRIEAGRISDKEIEFLLANLESEPSFLHDKEKLAGYAFALKEIFSAFEVIDFSENNIKKLHKSLLKFYTKDQKHCGEYKTFSNNVEAFDQEGESLGIVFETTSPFKTPVAMQELIFWTQEHLENKQIHPLIIIGIFVASFLKIHPFQEGNSRLSNLLTIFLLLKCGYSYILYSSFESIFESNKENYYLALYQTQQSLKTDQPDFEPWLIFFLNCLQKQKDYLNLQISYMSETDNDLSMLSMKVLELIKEHRNLNLKNLENLTSSNKHTLKKNLSKLVKKGYILQKGKAKATYYCLPVNHQSK